MKEHITEVNVKKAKMTITVMMVLLVVVGTITAVRYYLSNTYREGRYFLIDEDGNRISERSYNIENYKWDEKSDYIIVGVENKWKDSSPNHKYLQGVVDAKEEFLFEPIEGDLRLRADGFFEDKITGNLYDETGLVLEIKDEDESISMFWTNELARVKGKDGLFGFIDKDYNYVIEKQFVECYGFYENGLAYVITTEGKHGVINTKGEYVIPPIYDDIGFLSDDEEPFYVEKSDGNYIYIDETGKQVIDDMYEEAYSFLGGFAVVRKNGRYHVINHVGDILAEVDGPLELDRFSDLAVLPDGNGKYGAIDTSGNLLIPYEYDSISQADDKGNLIVELDGFYGIIDRNGNAIVPIKYRSIRRADDCGIYAVLNGKMLWGYVNSTGEQVIPCRFDECESFSENGIARAKGKNGLYGFIDTNGNWLIDPIYTDATSFNSKLGVAAVSLIEEK